MWLQCIVKVFHSSPLPTQLVEEGLQVAEYLRKNVVQAVRTEEDTTTPLYLRPAAGSGLVTEQCMESVEHFHSFQTEIPVLTEHVLTLSLTLYTSEIGARHCIVTANTTSIHDIVSMAASTVSLCTSVNTENCLHALCMMQYI